MGHLYENILETVGRTPVIRINRMAPEGVNLYVKNEAFNPLGSVKDRLALGIIEAFAVFQCGDSDLPRKPDPAGLLGVVEALGAKPATAFMVGDSIADVEAARAAGLRGVILVSHGYSVTPVTELGADMVIDGFSELPQALARFAPGLEHEI